MKGKFGAFYFSKEKENHVKVLWANEYLCPGSVNVSLRASLVPEFLGKVAPVSWQYWEQPVGGSQYQMLERLNPKHGLYTEQKLAFYLFIYFNKVSVSIFY